jgi:uncharacterized protein YcbX
VADLVARIGALWRYPVKACAGESVQALKLDAGGWPEGDRVWAIADATGELTWMGAHPRLALVSARLTPECLTLHAGGRTLELEPDTGTAAELRAWNGDKQGFDHFSGWDAGDDAAALLRATTGERLRLVRLSAEAQRRPGLNALHLVGNSSLQAWQEALGDAPPQPLSGLALRARPNLVLQAEDGGELPAFIEDIVVDLRVGELTFKRTLPCVRCVVPTVDPVSAEPQPLMLDVLTRLSAERAPGAPVQFGVYLAGSGGGRVSVGDRVELTLDFGDV